MADISGTLSSDLPMIPASPFGAASTVPLRSTSAAATPGRPSRLSISFDSQSRLMLATTMASDSLLMAATG